MCVEPQSVSEDRLGPLGLKVTGASHASELMVELSLETGIFTLLLRSHVTLGMWSHLSEPRPCLTSKGIIEFLSCPERFMAKIDSRP